MKKLLSITLSILFAAASVFAADGDLDTSFGGTGIVSETFYQLGSFNWSVAVQPDGKIISAGYSVPQSGIRDFTLARYNPNGTLDATFGTNGKLTADNSGKDEGFPEVFVLSDGKILLVGQSQNAANNPAIVIMRFNSNGALDTTFGANGIVVSAYTTEGTRGDVLGDAIVQADGKIVVTGQWQGTSFCVGRFNENGAVDASFGTNGSFCAPTIPIGAGVMRSLALQADGKIVVAGKFQTSFTVPSDFIVFRFNTNGSLDTSFDGDGYAITDLNNNYDEAYSVHVLPDGKILAAGRGGVSGSTQYGFGIARYNANGSLDATFDGDGKAVQLPRNTAGSERYASVVLENGKLVVARNISPTSGFLDDSQVARFNTDGSVDTTFGTGGQVLFLTTRFINAITKQADGKIVFVGANDSNQAVTVRLLNTDSAAPVNNPTLRIADFDGDAKTDIAVFRSGTWFINPSSNPSAFAAAPNAAYGIQFGQAGDVVVPADFDGDGKSDIAVWRAANFANFYILQSSNNTFRAAQFGTTGDNPTVSGDWDADGKADLAVYRGATANGGQSFFYYRPSSQAGVDFVPVQWGTGGDTPIFGDFDGDKKLDAAVYRPSNNTFYVRQSSTGAPLAKQWGNAATDAIFAGDFDGDGKSDFAVQRFSGAEAGTWYVAQSGGTNRAIQWGTGSDTPVPADYDGDGKMDVAVFRRSNATWYILQSATNTARYSVFGASGDFPLPLSYVR